MTGTLIDANNHCLRYVKPSWVEDDVVDGSAFRLRPEEKGLSVYWVEFFQMEEAHHLVEIRKDCRLGIRPNGRFAEFRLRDVYERISSDCGEITCEHKPLPADDIHNEDRSHSELIGLPAFDDEISALVGDMVADCVKDLHLAVEVTPPDPAASTPPNSD